MIQEDEYTLVAETYLEPVQIFEAGKLLPIAFPNQAYKYSFREHDHWTALAKLSLLARRVRAYLAFLLGFEVPLRYAFVGDRVFIPHAFGGGVQAGGSFRAVGPALFHVEQREAALREMGVRLKMTDVLLGKLEQEDRLDRAVVHVGEAVSSSDPLDVLFHCWRAIEVVSAERTSAVRLPGKSAGGALAVGESPSPRSRLKRNELEVAGTVHDLISLDISNEVGRWNKCRDAVAHARERPSDARYASLNQSRLLAVGFWTTWAMVARRAPEVATLFDPKEAAKIPPTQVEPEEDPALTERIRSSLREDYNRRKPASEPGRSV